MRFFSLFFKKVLTNCLRYSIINVELRKGRIKMTIDYTPRGVCSRKIIAEVEDGIVKSVQFVGGCNGNTQGISKLVAGMKVEDVIKRLENVNCNGRGTSCPDQLANALRQAL